MLLVEVIEADLFCNAYLRPLGVGLLSVLARSPLGVVVSWMCMTSLWVRNCLIWFQFSSSLLCLRNQKWFHDICFSRHIRCQSSCFCWMFFSFCVGVYVLVFWRGKMTRYSPYTILNLSNISSCDVMDIGCKTLGSPFTRSDDCVRWNIRLKS